MISHNLKTWPEYFHAIVRGEKTFEIRHNDRGFAVGDHLILQEYCPRGLDYTGESITVVVTYITTWEQPRGQVVMGFRNLVTDDTGPPSDDPAELARREIATWPKWKKQAMASVFGLTVE